ncbi:MAG: metal-dependent hydrolase [Chitinophagales bacterium]|nr:metal-dependent hydrolase [Chitinophagales bacterium]
MKITYYGHACFGVNAGGKNLLFDPFITHNELAKSVDITTIPADYILLSHGHDDHVMDAMTIANRTGATIVAAFEVAEWFEKQGAKIHSMNHGGKWNFDFGSVKLVNAVHSSVMPDGSYGGNPAGFVIESAEGNFYYSGDTALTMDMQLIPMICKPLTVALLNLGDNYTMGVDDAVIASDFVKCNKVIGLHYDTFGYIKINHEEAKQKFAAKGKELLLLNIGETISI